MINQSIQFMEDEYNNYIEYIYIYIYIYKYIYMNLNIAHPMLLLSFIKINRLQDLKNILL